MDPEKPAAAAGAAAALKSSTTLQQKNEEYEQTALRLSLCSDESLASVLGKLLPRAFMELMTCQPVCLPKVIGIVNSCLRRVKEAPEVPVPAEELLHLLSAAEQQQRTGEKQPLLEQQLEQLQLPPIRPSNLPVHFDKWAAANYSKMLLLMLECLGAPQVLQTLKHSCSSPMGVRVLEALAAQETVVVVPNAVNAAAAVSSSSSSSSSSKLPCYSKPSPPFLAALQAICELLLLGGELDASLEATELLQNHQMQRTATQVAREVDWTAFRLREQQRSHKTRRGKIGTLVCSCFVDVVGSQQEASRPSGAVTSATSAAAEETSEVPVRGLSAGSVKLWSSCKLSRQELVIQQTRAVQLLTKAAGAARVADEKVAAAAAAAAAVDDGGAPLGAAEVANHAQGLTNVSSSEPRTEGASAATTATPAAPTVVEQGSDIILPPAILGPIILGSCAPYASISDPCTAALTRLATVTNTDDELLLYLLFDLVLLRPLQQLQQLQRLPLLLGSTSLRTQDYRGPLPSKMQQKLLQHLCRSRAAAERRFCLAVLQLQWESLGLLQRTLQWGISPGQPTARVTAALNLLQWCLRLQRWFCCDVHVVDSAAATSVAASTEATQQQPLNQRMLCPSAARVGCLLLDFFSRALEQLLLVAAPPASELLAADLREHFDAFAAAQERNDNTFRGTPYVLQQFMQCSAAVFAADAVVSPDLVYQISQSIISPTYRPRTPAELLLQPATRELFPLLLDAISTACRVCPFSPFIGDSNKGSSSSSTKSCSLATGVEENSSWSESCGAEVTEGMLQLLQQLLLLLPRAIEADAQQNGAKVQSQRRRAASVALSLSATLDNPTTPAALQALRSCGDWLAMRLGSLREALQQQSHTEQQQRASLQQLQQQYDYLEQQLIAMLDWTFAMWLRPPETATVTNTAQLKEGELSEVPLEESEGDPSVSFEASQQVLLQEALRLAAKAFPANHPAHSFYCMLCLSVDAASISSGRFSNNPVKVSVAEMAAGILKQCERQESPSFAALLHFSLPRLGPRRDGVLGAGKTSSQSQGPLPAYFSADPSNAQQQLAAAANASPEEAAKRLLPLAVRLAELLHGDLRLNACMRLDSKHKPAKDGEPGAEKATAATAPAGADASLPVKKLRITSKDDLIVPAGGVGLGAEEMRLFAVTLLPLLVARHPDEAVNASMRCTFCRCWMGLLRWQEQHSIEQRASLLPLLSLQVPLLISSVLFAPLGASFAAAPVAADATAEKRRGGARHAVQQTREDARRAAADLVRFLASALRQQQQQQMEPQMLQASGDEQLLAAFLPFLSGSAFGVQKLRELNIFIVEPPLQQQRQTALDDTLYLQLKEAVKQHQELPLQTQEQQQQQAQRLPTPGELAGSLVVVGSVFCAGDDELRSRNSTSADEDITVQAVSAVLKHFCFWAAAYCGEECVKTTFPQQLRQHQIAAFAAYTQHWSDALLLCSLEALSRALTGHWPSVLVAMHSLDGTQQHEQEGGRHQEQRRNSDAIAIESLLSLLTTISKASLSRCIASETGLLLPAANASQRTALLLFHSCLQSIASLASLCASQACTLSGSGDSNTAAWRGPYHRAVKCLVETAPLVAPQLRSAAALAVVRLVLDLHRMRLTPAAGTVAAETERHPQGEGTAISGEVKQVLLLVVQLVQLQQLEAASDGKKASAGEEEQAAAAALGAATDSAAANGISADLARLIFASPNLKVSMWHRVSSSGVCWLAALLLHAKHLPEVAAMLLQFQRVFLSRVGDADTFVGHCAWRGLSRCFLAASFSKTTTPAVTSTSTAPTAAPTCAATTTVAGAAAGGRPSTMRDMLLHELSLHVGSRISTGPSEQALKMQGFSVQRLQEQTSNMASSKDESNDSSLAGSAELRDKEGGLARSKLLRQLLQTAKDTGHTALVYALLDQPLPPLFVEPLCVAACDVSSPCFCLPSLRQHLLYPHGSFEAGAASDSAAPVACTKTSTTSEAVKVGDEALTGVATAALDELEALVVEAQVSALRFCCPLSLLFGLSVYFWHSTVPLRQVVEMLSQSVYGVSSMADLTGPGPAHSMLMSALQRQKQPQQKLQLTAWQHVVQQIVKRLQSPNQLLREAACKAGADVLKRGHDWAEVEPFFTDLWHSGARCLDDVVDEVRAAAAALGRALKTITVEICCEGPPLVATVSLLQQICELHAGNKELRILCLDVLGDCVANCFASQRRRQSKEPVKLDSKIDANLAIDATSNTASDSSSSSQDWLVPLVLFLIEGLAAFEPRAFSFHQFHAEKMHGVSQKDFEKARVSLSQTSRAAKILKDIARQMDLNAVGPLVRPLVQKLRGSVGVPSRCGVCFFVCWLFDEWGSKIPEVATHSKRLLKAFARSLLDSSPSVRGAAIEAFSVVSKFASPQAMQEVIENQLLQLPSPECINIQEREEAQLGVGNALLHVSRRSSELFNGELKGAIGAVAFCLRHSSNTKVSEVYTELWTEVAGSDAFGIPRYLCFIKVKLQQQLDLSVREERLTAARAVSTIAAHVASIWKGGLPSEFADAQEVSVIRDLHDAVSGRLSQASFKGAAPLYIAALDAGAALDGLLTLQRLFGSAASGGKLAVESESTVAANSRGGNIAKRLLRLHASDKLAVVAHISAWLQLLPPGTRASQPFDELLALVHCVLQRVDRGSPDEDESAEEGGLEKDKAEQQGGTASSSSNRQLNSHDEAALRAGMLALLRLIRMDLCLILGVECEPKAEAAAEGLGSDETVGANVSAASLVSLPTNEDDKSIPVFTAWKCKGSDCSSSNKNNNSSSTSGNGHVGVKEFLNLFVRYQLMSVQLKIDLLQWLSDLLSLLTNLSVCLCAVAEPREWWAVFTRLGEQLGQRKYPRLRLAAAKTAAELVRHYIHVGSSPIKRQEELHQQHTQQAGEGETALTEIACVVGGDTQLHRSFCLPMEKLLTVTGSLSAAPPTEAAAAESLQAVSTLCYGTWSVLSLCVSPPAPKHQQQEEEETVSEMGGRVQEMQRSLRQRLSEAQDRENTCCKEGASGVATRPDSPQ